MWTLYYTKQVQKDASAKHGISKSASSRLGGLTVAIVVIIYIAGLSAMSPYTPGFVRATTIFTFGVPFSSVACWGLQKISSLIFWLPRSGWVSPIFIPLSVGSYAIDVLLNMPILGWALVTVFAVGFINALNMADGANGLVPGIAVASFGYLFVCAIARTKWPMVWPICHWGCTLSRHFKISDLSSAQDSIYRSNLRCFLFNKTRWGLFHKCMSHLNVVLFHPCSIYERGWLICYISPVVLYKTPAVACLKQIASVQMWNYAWSGNSI